LEALFKNKAYLDAAETFKRLELENAKLIAGQSNLPDTLPKKSKKLECSLMTREEKAKVKYKR
jgi:hypothetical protein